MLVGIDVYVQLSDHMTIAHVDVYRTQVAAVRGERVTTMPARQPIYCKRKPFIQQ